MNQNLVVFLFKINDGADVINLDDYSDIRTHWISFYANNNNVTYFDSFGVEHILKEITKNLSKIKTLKQIFSECKHIIQQCVDIFVLDLLILCLKEKL